MKTQVENLPIDRKIAITIKEAAEYSNIGICKLFELTNEPLCPFVLWVGNKKRLIKRKEFEKFISEKEAI
ncbi:MAG: DNA-binding protein [Lachnospiraceae bacterium]|nr:DNA-binding protein [Lachnospiraceae bacterium]